MIVKIISTQSIDFELYPETNGRPWVIFNTAKYNNDDKKCIKSLDENKKAGLIDYEIIEK